MPEESKEHGASRAENVRRRNVFMFKILKRIGTKRLDIAKTEPEVEGDELLGSDGEKVK